MTESSRRCRKYRTDFFSIGRLTTLAGVLITLFQISASGQQVVWNRSTGVTVHLPEMWKQVHSWQLDNPELSLYHAIDAEGGAQISIKREPCRDPSYRADWVSGALANKVLDPDATVEPLPESDPVRIDGSTGLIETIVRDTTTYKSRSFFLARGNRCYLTQFIGLIETFDNDAAMFASMANDLEFEDPGTDRAVLRIATDDTTKSVEFEADFSDGSGLTRATTPYVRTITDQTWSGLIRTVGGGVLRVDMEIENAAWHGRCDGTTLFFERRDRWGFCRGM